MVQNNLCSLFTKSLIMLLFRLDIKHIHTKRLRLLYKGHIKIFADLLLLNIITITDHHATMQQNNLLEIE